FWRSFPQPPTPKLFALANHQKSSPPNRLPPNPPKPAHVLSASLSALALPPEKLADTVDEATARHFHSHARQHKRAWPGQGFRFRPPPWNQVPPRHEKDAARIPHFPCDKMLSNRFSSSVRHRCAKILRFLRSRYLHPLRRKFPPDYKSGASALRCSRGHAALLAIGHDQQSAHVLRSARCDG